MIAYQIANGHYTGRTIEVGAGIIPTDYVALEPLQCADDEAVKLVGGNRVIVKKTDIIEPQEPAASYDLSSLRDQKIRELEAVRMRLEEAGCPFVFGSVGDTIQTRDERDFININGVATSAMLMKSAGETGAVIEFRAQSDTSYMLTPDRALDLAQAVAARAGALYLTQWRLKDAVASASTAAEINAINWPGV